VTQTLVRKIAETTGFRNKRRLVGLDIGSCTLKAVQLTPAGQGHRVAGFAAGPIPPGSVIDGSVADGQAVSAAVRCLFDRAGLGPAPVAVAVPAKAAIVKRITLPAMTGRELEDAVRWEAEQQVPLPLADVRWHYEPLGAGHGAKTLDVLLVAAHRDTVDALATVIADAGQTAVVVDVGALALHHAHQASGATVSGAVVALLDIGARATTVTIVVNGEPAFVRHVPLAGDAYTEALQGAFDVSFETADALKRQAPEDRAHRGALAAAQRPITDALLDEIRKTFEFFRSTTGTERVDSLVVSGGGSLLHGLTDALKHRFNTPVETVDPFRLLGDPPGHAGAVRDLHARTMGVAVGLALHREGRR